MNELDGNTNALEKKMNQEDKDEKAWENFEVTLEDYGNAIEEMAEEPDHGTPIHDSSFEVKDKSLGTYTIDEFDTNQKTIDFELTSNEDMTNSTGQNKDEGFDFMDEEKTSERIDKIKKHQAYLKNQGYLEEDKENEIEELENQPAFIRKNRKIKKSVHSSNRKISKYSLYDDEENGTRLSSDNTYLHDNVD